MTKQTRIKAMSWWNDLSNADKGLLMEGNLKHRHPQSLTGSEIEILWDIEYNPIHMVSDEETKAIKWWNSLSLNQQQRYANEYILGDVYLIRNREVLNMWKSEFNKCYDGIMMELAHDPNIDATNALTKDDLDFIKTSLNQTYHYAHSQLEDRGLGDLERKYLEQTKKQAKVLMTKLEF